MPQWPLKNGVVTSEACEGIARKWLFDVTMAAFRPIREAAQRNGGGLWFYHFGGFPYPTSGELETGDWYVLAQIVTYLAVPQRGAPRGVFIYFEASARTGFVDWIQFPLAPELPFRINDILLSQKKGRIKAKLVTFDLSEIIDGHRLVRGG